MQVIFMLHWINPERAFICILLQNDHGQLRNMWQYFSSLLVAFKAMRNQTSGWTLTTLRWSASSVLPGADTRVRRLVPLDPFAFNLPLPAHVNTALMSVPSRAALRPRRFPYFRLNSAIVKMLMPTKIKDVAKESYKTRRLLRFLLFGLLCSLSLRIGKGKSFYLFFSVSDGAEIIPAWTLHVGHEGAKWRTAWGSLTSERKYLAGDWAWESNKLCVKTDITWEARQSQASWLSCCFRAGRFECKQCWLAMAVVPGWKLRVYWGAVNRNLSKWSSGEVTSQFF